MKYLILFLLVFSFNAHSQSAVQTMTVKTTIYCDHCVQCETCGDHFNKKLLREKGVQMVTLDPDAMTIKVIYNSKKTSPAIIREAISKLGYDADDVKADSQAYAALDGCCKKE